MANFIAIVSSCRFLSNHFAHCKMCHGNKVLHVHYSEYYQEQFHNGICNTKHTKWSSLKSRPFSGDVILFYSTFLIHICALTQPMTYRYKFMHWRISFAFLMYRICDLFEKTLNTGECVVLEDILRKNGPINNFCIFSL